LKEKDVFWSPEFLLQYNQQQFELVSEHPQVGSVFFRIPLMIPAAQPTPEFTDIACTGQLIEQAPHSIQ
jgi:hypothetical protein